MSSAVEWDPFGLAATPSAYVPRASSERALQAIDRALRDGRFPAILGPPGLGKTLLLQRTAARVEHRTHPVYVPFCALSLPELCAVVLGFEEVPPTEDPLGTLDDIARQLVDRELGLMLLIDDASMMPLDTAKDLAEWVHSANGAVELVFASTRTQEVRDVLGAFGSRIEEIELSQPMTEAETRDYVERRLAFASAPAALREAFDASTIAELHAASGGIPRSVNVAAQAIVREVAPEESPELPEETATPPTFERSAAPAAGSPPPHAAPPEHPAARPPQVIVPGPHLEKLFEEQFETTAPEVIVPEGAPPPLATTPRPAPPTITQPAPQTPEPRSEPAPAPAAPASGAAERVAAIPPDASVWQELWARGMALMDGVSRRPVAAASTWVGAVVLGLIYGWASAPDRVEGPVGQPAVTSSAVSEVATQRVGVNAYPWALIEIDGTEVGETPIAGIELSEGAHTFRAYMPDGKVREKVVIIDAFNHTVSFD
jgi:type II secretory pathway predicted ATPase ExeA